MEINKLIGLSNDELERRVREIIRTVPTIPGTKFLEKKLEIYKIQPWPFIMYMAYWAPTEFQDLMNSYKDYDGAESTCYIREMIKDELCIQEAIKRIENKTSGTSGE